MKYMKLGVLPDTFYTEEAARTVLSDVPSDLHIQIKNVRYHLHKCGLLQSLSSKSQETSETAPVSLHDIPGGEEAFELCAKFCYGISIKLSAHNFVQAICAAKYLKMTESVAKGNLLMKIESFFESCILQGWKDPIVVLQSTRKAISWSENLGIVNRCMEVIIQKILTHPSKVSWSYTYTRPGYDKKQQRLAPKDWWTEDVSDLDLDLFRSIMLTVRSSKQLPSPLIGEALHVYACKHLLDPSEPQSTPEYSNILTEQTITKQRRILESIVSMIPIEHGCVSGGFMLRLLKIANYVGASPSTKAELVRRSGRLLHEVTADDLLFPLPITDPQTYDIDMVEAVLEVFLVQFRHHILQQDVNRMLASMIKVAKTIDSYLQAISHKTQIPVSRFVELARSLPELARPEHDHLYWAIDVYLKEHPELSKAEKKHICQLLDCRKLSHEVRSHAITNDSLPLRTIVQVLFVEQEKVAKTTDLQTPHTLSGVIQETGDVEGKLADVEDRETDRQSRREQQSMDIGRLLDKSRSVSESKARTRRKKDKEIHAEESQGSKHKA